MIRTRTPRRVNQRANTNPVGPAPTIKTSVPGVDDPFIVQALSREIALRLNHPRRAIEPDQALIGSFPLYSRGQYGFGRYAPRVPVWKTHLIVERGKRCWRSRSSILCGDPRFSPFVSASAKC